MSVMCFATATGSSTAMAAKIASNAARETSELRAGTGTGRGRAGGGRRARSRGEEWGKATWPPLSLYSQVEGNAARLIWWPGYICPALQVRYTIIFWFFSFVDVKAMFCAWRRLPRGDQWRPPSLPHPSSWRENAPPYAVTLDSRGRGSS